MALRVEWIRGAAEYTFYARAEVGQPCIDGKACSHLIAEDIGVQVDDAEYLLFGQAGAALEHFIADVAFIERAAGIDPSGLVAVVSCDVQVLQVV